MTLTFGRVLGISTWLMAAVMAFGCQSIAGIEDRTLAEKPDECDAHCRACDAYCLLVMENCAGTDAVYQTPEACLGVCAELPLGDPIEPGMENTIACRAFQAQRAESTGEPADYCPSAGPGGGGICGTDCEAYCLLFPRICTDQGLSDPDACEAKCEILRDTSEFSIDLAYDATNVECRLIHLSNATVGNQHCDHAKFVSTLHCMRLPGEDPDCDLACEVVMGACSGDLAVYDDIDQCKAVCEALPPGTNDDVSENTQGCRVYHAHSSLVVPENHCPHAGPGGAGHCGQLEGGVGNCESYCILAEQGCPTEFNAEFADQEACQAECVDLDGAADDEGTDEVNEAEKYSVSLGEAADALPFRCRLLHVTRAVGNADPSECDAAFAAPGSPCQ